ncbi:MAG: 2Fe-2S iron-sulfur cluster binding domain-containing protein [Chloroflexi bacterium]|nr:2Fe-2S iron-sulfur cluster binding domain-containing protein [Chloroflexota bacterium]
MIDPERGTRTRETTYIAITVNGTRWQGDAPVEEVLLDLLRSRIGLTGTKRGCESEVCGACTVLVDGAPISSCNYLAFEADGKAVTTVEGLARGDELHPLQEGFIRNVAAQCGYCTPGQLMAAKALLEENPTPSYGDIAHWLTGNICRCGCYPAIASAILEVVDETKA